MASGLPGKRWICALGVVSLTNLSIVLACGTAMRTFSLFRSAQALTGRSSLASTASE